MTLRSASDPLRLPRKGAGRQTGNAAIQPARMPCTRISSAEARALAGQPHVVLLDIRDGSAVAVSGKANGALHVSRGLLEFRKRLFSTALRRGALIG